MSSKLKILERQFARQNPERPAPEPSSLGASIDAMVQQAVKDQVADALVKQPPSHVQRIRDQFDAGALRTDYRELPAVPKTAPAKNMNVQVFRDGAGLMRWITVNNSKFEIQRDGADRIVGMRQVDESPVLPALDIAVKAEARQYQDGV